MLYVPKYSVRTPIVPTRVTMKRIGKIATENRSQAKIYLLADSVPSAQHADIRMDAHHYDIHSLDRL